MATYIKTLKEDNGDITYPQTKAGAVYTDGGSDVQTELDDCTRYEEIASTGTLAQTVPASIIDWSSIPIRQVQTSFGNIGTDLLVVLTRYGNLVICNYNFVVSSASQYDEAASATCPSGYRPKYDAVIVGNMTAGGSTVGCFQFRVAPTGQVYLSCTGVSSRTRVQGTGVWFTENAMPS